MRRLAVLALLALAACSSGRAAGDDGADDSAGDDGDDTSGPPDAPGMPDAASAPDAAQTIGELCFGGLGDPSQPGPNYDQFHPTVGTHCAGTNHQAITGIEKVVFL